MIPTPKSELTILFISFTIMIGAIAGIGFFYLTSSIGAILNTISNTENNVIGNVSDHRVISNITRDSDDEKLNIIIAKQNVIVGLLNDSLTPHTANTP